MVDSGEEVNVYGRGESRKRDSPLRRECELIDNESWLMDLKLWQCDRFFVYYYFFYEFIELLISHEECGTIEFLI